MNFDEKMYETIERSSWTESNDRLNVTRYKNGPNVIVDVLMSKLIYVVTLPALGYIAGCVFQKKRSQPFDTIQYMVKI